MSKMSDLHLDITTYIADGFKPEEIAKMLHIPIEWVMTVYDEFVECQYY
jgi:hypothetical protein